MTQQKNEVLSTALGKQVDKFKAMAKEVGADGDEPAFDAALKKLAKAKPQPKK